jgi:hypothetical protein
MFVLLLLMMILGSFLVLKKKTIKSKIFKQTARSDHHLAPTIDSTSANDCSSSQLGFVILPLFTASSPLHCKTLEIASHIRQNTA